MSFWGGVFFFPLILPSSSSRFGVREGLGGGIPTFISLVYSPKHHFFEFLAARYSQSQPKKGVSLPVSRGTFKKGGGGRRIQSDEALAKDGGKMNACDGGRELFHVLFVCFSL